MSLASTSKLRATVNVVARPRKTDMISSSISTSLMLRILTVVITKFKNDTGPLRKTQRPLGLTS